MSKNNQVVFAISPPDEQGIRTLILGVTREAWVHMKDGNTHNFEFSKANIPLHLMMFGGKDHQSIMRALDAGMKLRGKTYEDARHKDFAPEQKFTDEEALRELAKGTILRELLEQVQQCMTTFVEPERHLALRARIEALLASEEPTKE